MGKITYRHGAMNASKSASALILAHNYKESGGNVLLTKSSLDTRAKDTISSRVGIEKPVDLFINGSEKVYNKFKKELDTNKYDAIIIDEAQFLNRQQVNDIVDISNDYNVHVIAYGLKVDFSGESFEGASYLMAHADSIEEVPTICSCCGENKKKARYNMRVVNGNPVFEGEQVVIGAEESYQSVCRKCYLEKKKEFYKKRKKNYKIPKDIKKIYVDFDGTLVNSIKAFCDVYNYIYHTEIQKNKIPLANWKEVNKWNFSDQCVGLKRDKIIHSHIFNSRHFFQRLEFFKNAKSVMETLHTHGYHIIICTSATPENAILKIEWINNFMPFADVIPIISNQSKGYGKDMIDMSDAVFIDDHAENLNNNNAVAKFCFGEKKEWNENLSEDVIRLNNWQDFLLDYIPY